MKISATNNKLFRTPFLRGLSLLLVVILAVAIGIHADRSIYAASGTPNMSLTPTTGTYTVGQTITVAVNEDSGSTSIYAAQGDVNYPSTLLTYTGSSCSSTFGLSAPTTTGTGTVDVDCASSTALTGAQVVDNITFIVSAAGTAPVTLASSCGGSSTSNCSAIDNGSGTNIGPSVSGASYTLQAASSSSTGGSTGGSSSGGGSSGGGSTSSSTSSSAGSLSTTKTAITHTNSVTPTVASNNATVTTTTPVAVQPATVQTQGVTSVSYYLNGKLVYVAKTPPFTYDLNTKSLLNGKYTLTSKTLYDNGMTATSTQHLKVANPFSFTQARLFTKHYLALPIGVLILLVALLFVWIKRRSIATFIVGRGSGPSLPPSTPLDTQTPIAPTVGSTINPTVGSGTSAFINKLNTSVPPPTSVIKPSPSE